MYALILTNIILFSPGDHIPECDIIEFNTTLDSEYKISIEQWIFWNYDIDKQKYIVSDFIVTNIREKLSEGQIKQKEREIAESLKTKQKIIYIPQIEGIPIFRIKEYYCINPFNTRSQKNHKVKSKIYIESITMYDPETANRSIVPVNERISILK